MMGSAVTWPPDCKPGSEGRAVSKRIKKEGVVSHLPTIQSLINIFPQNFSLRGVGGRTFFRTYKKFSGHIQCSNFSRHTKIFPDIS